MQVHTHTHTHTHTHPRVSYVMYSIRCAVSNISQNIQQHVIYSNKNDKYSRNVTWSVVYRLLVHYYRVILYDDDDDIVVVVVVVFWLVRKLGCCCCCCCCCVLGWRDEINSQKALRDVNSKTHFKNRLCVHCSLYVMYHRTVASPHRLRRL